MIRARGQRSGMTLLEVLVALAICAGLLLMVFTAMPALEAREPARAEVATMLAEAQGILYQAPYRDLEGELAPGWHWQRRVEGAEGGHWLHLEMRHEARSWSFESWVPS